MFECKESRWAFNILYDRFGIGVCAKVVGLISIFIETEIFFERKIIICELEFLVCFFILDETLEVKYLCASVFCQAEDKYLASINESDFLYSECTFSLVGE